MATATGNQGPFSHPNRVQLIDEYFGELGINEIAPEDAWLHVYRLLLWSDPTTGLAHCYESDKAQPGRPWYARSLAFHEWLAARLGVTAGELPDHLDWMFRRVIAQVAGEAAARQEQLAATAAAQREAYAADMPEPGEDPELRQLIESLLPSGGPERPSEEHIGGALRQMRAYIASENKRKNLLGRGFEDVLAAIVRHLDAAPPVVATQTPIEEISGFRQPRSGDKTEKVDLWVGPTERDRILVSAKWSVRSDREKQMRSDFLTYIDCNELRDPFEYVWITNEFDPARLVANATATHGNAPVFAQVVHVCPEGLNVVHDLDRRKLPRSPAALKDALTEQRIIGLSDWLGRVRQPGS
jgi:hypothetical protein